jgi:hypothetical protein
MVRVVDRVDAVGFRVNATTDDDDPRPEPPAPPDADACCGSGCSPCVFDVYEDARERYLDAARLAGAADAQDTAANEQAFHPCQPLLTLPSEMRSTAGRWTGAVGADLTDPIDQAIGQLRSIGRLVLSSHFAHPAADVVLCNGSEANDPPLGGTGDG